MTSLTTNWGLDQAVSLPTRAFTSGCWPIDVTLTTRSASSKIRYDPSQKTEEAVTPDCWWMRLASSSRHTDGTWPIRKG